MEKKIFKGKNIIEQMNEFNRKRFQKFTGLSDEQFKRGENESIEDYRKRIRDAISKKHPGLARIKYNETPVQNDTSIKGSKTSESHRERRRTFGFVRKTSFKPNHGKIETSTPEKEVKDVGTTK